jgi:TolB protein
MPHSKAMKRRAALVVLLAPPALLALIVALAATAPIEQAQGAFPGDNGRIAFSANLSGRGEYSIYSRGRGGGIKRLTRSNCFSPSYSPDGRKIVFTRSGGGRPSGIWVMRADGSHERHVIGPRKGGGQPSFSPSGKKIVFQRNNYVWKMSLRGVDRQRLARGYNPTFSPDGRRIAFITAQSDLAVMRPSGSGIETLAVTDGSESDPDFSPNGRRIVFERDPTGAVKAEIYSIRADGTGLKRLTDNFVSDLDPVFSPSGGWIAFVSDRRPQRLRGAYEIFRKRPDGSSLERLTRSPARVQINDPTWGVRP